MSSQPDSTTNQIDASAKTNDTKMSTPKDGEKTVNSNLNNGADDKKLQQTLTTSTSTPSKTAAAAVAAATTTATTTTSTTAATTTVTATAVGVSTNTAAAVQPAKSSIESEDTSDKRASSFNSNNFSNKSTVTNSTYKRVTQSTDAERATESDSLSNPNAASVSPYTGENSSSLAVLKTHPNYGGSNSHRGPHRQIGQTTDFHNNSDGHTSSSSENLSRTNLYIRGLTPTTTDQDLYNMCAKFGGIVSTKAIQDKVSGNCKGYGFVLFSAPQSAELAVAELTKTGIQAQMARVPNNHESLNKHSSYHNTTTNNNNNHNNNSHYHHNHYTHANQHQNHHGSNNHSAGTSSMVNNHSHNNANHPNVADPTNLYLANLPTNMNEAELEALMSTFGPVVSTRILRDEGFNPRGVGFARMESRDKCQEIIEKLNGKPYKGSGEPLLVKFADGGNRKRHHNNHHHHHHHHNNSHHKMAHDNARWRESGDAVENVSQPNFEHQRNLPHGSHMADLSMMGPMSYSRIQPTFSPANGPYPTSLGASTSTAQWMHPGSGQPWNVIPQLITPNNMGPSTQTAVPANYSFGHMTQLANQMQGLQITHHSGASMSGYMTQWPPVWPHHMPPPQQTPSHSVRTTAPMQSSPTNQHPQQQRQQQQQQQQQIPQVLTGATKTFTDDQEIPQAVSSKQLNSSDTDKQQIHAPL